MKNLKSAMDVAEIVKDFMRNEARSLALSQDKLYTPRQSASETLKQVG